MNEVGRQILYLQLLEEERPGQRGVCQGGHSRHFLVLKDIRGLFVHHDLRTKGGYAAAGDAAVLSEWILVDLELSESPSDEE